MKRIEFHPDAAQEANDAVDYYDERRAGLGEEFRADLRAALARIEENPELYAELSGVRECGSAGVPVVAFPLQRALCGVAGHYLGDGDRAS